MSRLLCTDPCYCTELTVVMTGSIFHMVWFRANGVLNQRLEVDQCLAESIFSCFSFLPDFSQKLKQKRNFQKNF